MVATSAPPSPSPTATIERPEQLSERLEQVAGKLMGLAKDAANARLATPLRECVLELCAVWSALRQFTLVFDANRAETMIEHERELRQAMDILNGTVASLSAASQKRASDVGRQIHELDELDTLGDTSLFTERLRTVTGSVRETATGLADDLTHSAERLTESGQIIQSVDRKLSEARGKVMRDSLTRVLSRVAFEQRVAELAGQSATITGAWCVAIADIDRFGDFNERHGRRVGDALLFRVAGIIQSTCDTYPGAIVGRYGGEEFAILLPRATLRDGRQMAEEIRGAVGLSKWECKATSAGPATVISATVSVGIAEHHPSEPAPSLLRRVESCLGQAKRRGRNTVAAEG